MSKFYLAIALLAATATPAIGGGAQFPAYDIAKACRTQADYAFAATLGQTDTDREIAACSERERDNMAFAKTLWPRASQKDAADCLGLADSRYGRLARCIETSRSLRNAR